MIPDDPNPRDVPPTLDVSPDNRPDELYDEPIPPARTRRLKITGIVFLVLFLIAVVGFFLERHHLGTQMRENLPQLDGSLVVYGLSAPVTVQRDAQGVPHIHASSLDDLVFAQGYITAQDRLWQMDILRRHAAGQLAEILGRSALDADRLQRTLQIRTAADRAVALLPPDQKRWLAIYANGVNASITAQHDHLPIEFRTIGYQPAPWTPRDSILVELAMFQDLTNTYTQKLGREAISAQLPPDLVADLYPTTSWRDHPPAQPIPDVTAPQPDIPDIPLDESQSKLAAPPLDPSATALSAADLFFLQQTLAQRPCDTCIAGSNGWAVAGSRTASGKPMLSNDMHLMLTIPGTWYEADLQADLPSPLTAFHAAGITLPGTPFVIAGHNQHVAWGFTNLDADVQDLYVEHTRGTPTGAEYQTPSGSWLPVRYQNEVIQIRGSADVTLSVPLTRHGEIDTPIISSIYPGERRSISLIWSVFDPTTLSSNFFSVDSAADWTSMLAAFSGSVGLPLNLMYADDQGHIGYHAVGRVPIRGDASNPSPLSPIPTDATAPDAAAHEWAGYIPFDQLPQAFDPPDGILATANSRVTPDGYRYPITLDWLAPYRTERIYKVLEASPQSASDANEPGSVPMAVPQSTPAPLASTHPLTAADMLALQNDVFSELDQVFAQRLAYAIDHATGPLKNDPALHQAADILRQWNGQVDANAAAPAIVNAARNAFWPMLLIPKLAPSLAPAIASGTDLSKLKNLAPDEVRASSLWQFYTWGNRGTVEEELLTHTPARWLPAGFANWDDFLAAVVQRGLRDAKAPVNLSTWQYGKQYPVNIEHPLFARSVWIERLIGLPIGTGPQPHSGDGTTVKMISAGFGPSERFTADLSDPDHTTLNVVSGQSGNPASPYFMDQFSDWLRGTTYPLPFSASAIQASTIHTLTLNPR